MSNRTKSRKSDRLLPSQTLSRVGAGNLLQSLRSQAFSQGFQRHHGGQQPSSSNNGSGGSGNSNSSNAIRCLAWNGSGTRVACGHVDRSIRVWIPDHSDSKGMTDIKNAHEQRAVESLSWDPLHADRLASCSTDGGLRIWDARAKRILAETQTGHENVVVRYSGDGRFLAVATAKTDTILIYHIKQQKQQANAPEEPPVKGSQVATTWKLTLVGQFRENEDIYDLQWAENGSRTSYVLASGLGNGNVRIYQFNTRSDENEKIENSDKSGLNDIELPDADDTKNDNGDISDKNSSIQSVYTLRGHRTAASCIAFDPKGCYLAVGSNEGIVSLWDLQEFICIKTFTKTE